MSTLAHPLERPSFLAYPEKLAVWVVSLSVTVAILFPYPMTKTLLAPVIGATFLYVSLKSFHLAISFFCFLLPLQSIAGNTSFFLRGANLQTAFIVFFLVLALREGSQGRAHGQRDLPESNPMTIPIIGLILIIFLSAAYSAMFFNQSFLDLVSRMKNAFAYVVLTFFGFRMLTEHRQKMFVLCSILLVTALNAAYSLRDIFTNPSLNVESNRAVSMISDQPNLYAGFLVLYAFYFIALLVHYPLSRVAKLIIAFGGALVLINLVYTLSRGAWLAFMAAAIIVTTLKSRKMLVPLLVISAAIYFWLPDVAQDRWQSGFEGEYDPKFLAEENVTVEDAASRIVQWKTFPTLLAENPVPGVGYGRYGIVIYQKRIDEKPRSAHSTFIEIGIEQGIVGLAFYLALLFTAYTGASKVFREASDPLDRTLGLGLMASTIGLFFLDLTGTRFRSGSIMAYYWILCGMTLNAVTTTRGSRRVARTNAEETSNP